MTAIIAVLLTGMIIANWVIQSRIAERDAIKDAKIMLEQVIRYVEKSEEQYPETGNEVIQEILAADRLKSCISSIPVRESMTILVIDAESGEILASTKSSLIREDIELLGISMDDLERYENGKTAGGNFSKNLYLLRQRENRIYGIREQMSGVYSGRMEQMLLCGVFLLILSITVLLAAGRLVETQAVAGLREIDEKLNEITEGNLETTVEADKNLELQRLSKSINKMVRNTLKATVKVSKVMDMVDIPIGVFEINNVMRQVMATEQLGSILMWTEEEAKALYSYREYFLARLDKIMQKKSGIEADVYQISEEPLRWVRIHMTIDEDSTVGVVIDVTDEILERKRIEHDRDYDVLTGLRNIRTFQRDVNAVLERGDSAGTVAMVMFDVDHFKGINDEFGHDWGDDYLRMFARFLKTFEEKKGIAARRSGDEFCVFLYEYDSREKIVEVIREFYRMMGEKRILFPDMKGRVISASGGVGWLDPTAEDPYSLMLKEADEALYEMKNSGRGNFRVSKRR